MRDWLDGLAWTPPGSLRGTLADQWDAFLLGITTLRAWGNPISALYAR